jgi:hypothetical protein
MLIKCTECNMERSSFASNCVHCGFPISTNMKPLEKADIQEVIKKIWQETDRIVFWLRVIAFVICLPPVITILKAWLADK